MSVTLVLLRHGESTWNREERFTGWIDVGLTDRGVAEAVRAGELLSEKRFEFDACHTSLLKRAIKTLWVVLETMDRMWLPVHASWRLNERHYGALQGLSRAQVAAELGEAQVLAWRRGFADRPPALAITDPSFPGNDPRYAALGPGQLPRSESLKDTVERVLQYWHEAIAPDLLRGRRLLISGHGNSLRALVKFLDDISDYEIAALEIPTGEPLVYELDERLKPIRRFYLKDAPGGPMRERVDVGRRSEPGGDADQPPDAERN
jgi:2,3-bisphosphoglycerate-dependent phosphoglycerate mutase